jgi:1,4-dihydroxy-2-naphthoate octaprenyltransferase
MAVMKLEQLLYGIFAGSVACFGVVALIIFNMSHSDVGFLGLGALFVSLFTGILGLLVLVFFQLRRRLSNNASYYDNLTTSFRQGVLGSVSLTGLLILQALRVLTPLAGVLFVLAIFSGEIYLRSRIRR